MTLFGGRKKKKKEENKKKRAFSKTLLIQESILVWIITIAFIALAFLCVFKTFDPQFAWFAILPGLAWTAYGVSQAMYYKKSQAENTEGGIIYETAMAQLEIPPSEIEE